MVEYYRNTVKASHFHALSHNDTNWPDASIVYFPEVNVWYAQAHRCKTSRSTVSRRIIQRKAGNNTDIVGT